MATIVSHSILAVRGKPNGYEKTIIQFTDDLGGVNSFGVNHPAGEDLTAYIAEMKTLWPGKLERQERAAISEQVWNNVSPDNISVTYLTVTEKVRQIVKTVMESKDPLSVMASIDYIDTQVTNAQLNNHFTLPQSNRIRIRIDAMVANKATLLLDQDRVEEL